jgi:hypothetical protein
MRDTNSMDGTRFDQLIKNIATTRLTRLTALRGLAVGAVAATIGVAAPDDAEARKKCGQCKKKVRRKTNDGKVRIRCKKKANGTFCSLAGVASATCQEGSCVASATPLPPAPRPPLPPTPFDCRAPGAGCTGQFAGLICNPATGQCVFCESRGQCGGGQLCNVSTGRCTGFEPCGNISDCAGVVPSGIEPAICNVNDNENPEAPENVCILDADDDYEGRCRTAADCPGQGACDAAGGTDICACVTNACVITCNEPSDCPSGYDCIEDLCLDRL